MMVDLIMASGAVLVINAGHPIAPKYGLFRMEANATIRCDVNLTLRADQAEFAQGCLIDASGPPGAMAMVFGGRPWSSSRWES